jgi:hypothetical protein
MKIHFITFADGLHEKYMKAAIALCDMAKSFDLFDTIKIFTINDLAADSDFINKHYDFLRNQRRGFGYWIWQPYIIWKTLCAVNEGDILVYLDSCCSLHVQGKQRFLEYLDIVKKNKYGTLMFDHEHKIGTWCKMDTIDYFDAYELLDIEEVVPGVVFTTANKHNKFIYKLIYDTCCDYHLVDDSPSILPNTSLFREHRHDQSITSIVFRKLSPSSIYHLPGEIYFPKGEEENKKFPIWIQSNNY